MTTTNDRYRLMTKAILFIDNRVGGTMKTLAIAGMTLAVMTGAGLAADLPRPAPPVPFVLPAPVFVWSGPYIGVNVGYGGDSYRYPFTLGAPAGSITSPNASLNSSGILGGGQVGYNFQLPIAPLGPYASSIVVGVEGDFDAASINGQGVLFGTSLLPGGNATGSAGTRTTAFGTARGRIGATIGRALFYGTGGFAFAEANTKSFATIGGIGNVATDRSRTHSGVAFGGGVEYLVTRNVSFKVEYLRASLDTKAVASGTAGVRSYAIGERPTENIIRAGLNYRLDVFGAVPLAPVVARY